MNYKKIGNKYFIRIQKGDKIIQPLTEFLTKNRISNKRITKIDTNTRTNSYPLFLLIFKTIDIYIVKSENSSSRSLNSIDHFIYIYIAF